jgi:cytochrome P450
MQNVSKTSRSRGSLHGIWRKLSVLRNSSNPLALVMQLAQQRGGCLPLRHQSQRVFLLTAVEHFKHVLATNSRNYCKYLDGMEPIFGASMITMDGTPWQRMRAVQQPAFHPDMISGYVPHFLTAIESRMIRWAEAADAAKPVDLCEETWALAADMTCRALFDRDMPFDAGSAFRAVKTFTDVSNHETVRLRHGDGGSAGGRDGDIARATERWIELPKAILDAAPVERRERTLLRLIAAANANPSAPQFAIQQLLDEIKQYVWAGTETTALMLAWALYLVATHDEVAAHIRHEARDVFGIREPTAADASRLTYTRNVIAETMRMYPPIWSLTRMAIADDAIGGHDIKQGDTVVLCIYAAHRDPRYWDEPDRFDPDRFAPERAKARPPYGYLPFGGGKRACIGGTMAQTEAVLALALFLRDFDFEYAGDDPVAVDLTVTLSPRNGLPFRISRRTRRKTSRAAISPARGMNHVGCPFDLSLSTCTVDGVQP